MKTVNKDQTLMIKEFFNAENLENLAGVLKQGVLDILKKNPSLKNLKLSSIDAFVHFNAEKNKSEISFFAYNNEQALRAKVIYHGFLNHCLHHYFEPQIPGSKKTLDKELLPIVLDYWSKFTPEK